MKSWSAIGAVIVLLFGAQIGAAQTSWKSAPSRSGAEAIATSDPVQWNKGWSSSSVAASRAPGDLGPLVPIRIGSSEMMLPDAYLSDISRRHGLNNYLIIDGIFPDFMPLNRENVESFRNREVNRVIRVAISGMENLQPDQRLSFPKVRMTEWINTQLRRAQQSNFETLWDRFDKSDSRGLNLFSFRIREGFLVPYVMEKITARPPVLRWYSELAQWDDWFFEEASGRIVRYIKCTNHLVPDPNDQQLNRACTLEEPCGPILVPYCEHRFLLEDGLLLIDLRYRRVYVKNWSIIEEKIRSVLERAIFLASERR